jgi:hypothetical protein
MQLKLGKIANPFSVFAIIWTISLCVYLLQWSAIFPAISAGLLVFLAFAILSTIVAGFLIIKMGLVKYVPVNHSREKYVKPIVLFNLFCWLLNFLYSGIPLIQLLRGAQFEIYEFGIPTFKVFVLSFNGFLCTFLFHHYLSTKKRKYLWAYLFGMLLFILIFSRGMIMMTLISTFFLWLLHKNTISLKNILGVTMAFLLILYLFGVAGNIRTAKVQTMVDGVPREYNSGLIYFIGQATDQFKASIIPGEFFWGYLYIASPISNLQYNIQKSETPVSAKNFLGFVSNELTYDFISKRINDIFNIPKLDYYLIIPELSVCTTFTGSYRYMGWAGLVLFFLFIILLPIVYIGIIGKSSPLLPVMLSIFTAMFFFTFFDNMFAYSGLGLQILYPVIFKYLRLS